tara:strand:- start:1455 stop:1769 length:315 start_codon:yes stop_codon:yes gene_type:complete
MRANLEMIRRQVELLNDLFGVGNHPFEMERCPRSGNLVQRVGVFVIDHAYGQPSINRLLEHGEEVVIPRGTRLQVYSRLVSFYEGAKAMQIQCLNEMNATAEIL